MNNKDRLHAKQIRVLLTANRPKSNCDREVFGIEGGKRPLIVFLSL